MKARGISLANKCQLLFGAAVILILTAALAVPWFRMDRMIDRGEREIARQIAEAWLENVIELGSVHETGRLSVPLSGSGPAGDASNAITSSRIGRLRIEFVPIEEARWRQDDDSLIRRAVNTFRSEPEGEAIFEVDRRPRQPIRYRYVRPITAEQLARVQDPAFAIFEDDLPNPEIANRLRGLLIVERNAITATGQLFINRTYIVLAGLFAGSLAVLVFYFITTRLILSPVRVLRETAERVSTGDLNVRSDIATGDEFEELSETFNQMLGSLKSTQDQLRQMNKSLDLRLTDVSRSNVMLLESNRLKSEFLANVSHELRTPLNSIIGFAEVIAELDENGTAQHISVSDKRRRYLANILTSGRNLLQMINDLLDLARIEAGRVEIQPELMSVFDVCESLLTLIRPEADKKRIHLDLDVAPSIPMIETDPGKFQQIIFNFLSNALKFTPNGGGITLSAQRRREHGRGASDAVQISVCDTGPGISTDDQKIIFEKFRQVDASHTRQYQGTGLGLAICGELATLLGGEVGVESEVGQGSTFILTLPVRVRVEQPQPLMPTPESTPSHPDIEDHSRDT